MLARGNAPSAGSGPETQEAWVDEQSRVVRPEVAQRLLEAFWSEVASKESVDLTVVFSPPGFGRLSESERLATEERIGQATQVIDRYLDSAPAKLVLRDSYETYLGRLGFGPESSDQCHEFTVYVANRDGVWKVSGLSWHSPEIPCQGDI